MSLAEPPNLCAVPSPHLNQHSLIHLVCRSRYSGVKLLDTGLDNCLSSIKCFCCLSSLCRWYFSHSCVTERRQRCSRKHVTHTHACSHPFNLFFYFLFFFWPPLKKNPVCTKHFYQIKVPHAKLEIRSWKHVKEACVSGGPAMVNRR